MAGFSTYLQQKVLDHVNGKTSYTMPTTYVALFTANPTDAGGGTEAAYTGYGRVATSGLWNAASGTSVTNASAIPFGACTAGSSTVTGFGLYDASSAGNLLYWGTCSLSVSSGITPQFAAGALTITLD
jgi:hypothetical protein